MASDQGNHESLAICGSPMHSLQLAFIIDQISIVNDGPGPMGPLDPCLSTPQFNAPSVYLVPLFSGVLHAHYISSAHGTAAVRQMIFGRGYIVTDHY